jgi:hypothetical protein
MFATIKSLIPEPRQADQPRHYVGRHRRADSVPPAAPVSPAPIVTGPASPAPVTTGAPDQPADEPAEETAAA